MSTVMTEEFVKIRVALSEHEDFAGESFWAKPLGHALYEIRNAPFLASHLNWGDVVKCDEYSWPRPLITEVVRRSGHRTLRLVFLDEATAETEAAVFEELSALGTTHEHAWGRLHAIDVLPGSDFERVTEYLGRREREGVVVYGTGLALQLGSSCEEDVPRSSGDSG